MAARRLRQNPQLQQFVLADVTPTGKVLGAGSFGSVEEVSYQRRICAGKKIHEALIDVENEGVARVVDRYLQECQLMSSLHHPNITQFLGLCFFPGAQLPLLVMEHLETNLDDVLEHVPNLPLSLKRSVLEDVASGLLYLHKRQSLIIHRDLTSKNVLLTSSLVAKITDMGNSRIVTLRPGQMVRTLTEFPGTLVYMPPEALDGRHCYGPSLDIFSFGHLALFTMIQVFPGELLSATYVNPDNNQELLARSEVERRKEYIDLFEARSPLPTLVELVKQCLMNDALQRPSAEEVLVRLQGLRAEVDGEYGSSHPIRLDLTRVRLAREAREKDRRIVELTQHQEQQQEDTARIVRQLEGLEGEIQRKDQLIVAKENLIAQKDREIALKDVEIQRCQRENEELQKCMKSKESEIDRLRTALKQAETPLELNKISAPLLLTWRNGSDLPYLMADNIQSVVIQGKMYVGGGFSGHDNAYNYIVMEYDPRSDKWNQLPSYRSLDFTMTAINNQLTTIGGYNYVEQYRDGQTSKVIGVWNTEWTFPYPKMPRGRSHCSAIVYKEWLVLAGGVEKVDKNHFLSSSSKFKTLTAVDVFNTSMKQWFTGPPMPIPWFSMKTAVVSDIGYFMGGFTTEDGFARFSTDSDINTVYCVSLPDIIAVSVSVKQDVSTITMWKKLPKLPVIRSSPMCIGGSLLAVGGLDEQEEPVASIFLYQCETEEWVKVGEMITPRFDCTSATITGRELLVVGGRKYNNSVRLDIATIETTVALVRC